MPLTFQTARNVKNGWIFGRMVNQEVVSRGLFAIQVLTKAPKHQDSLVAASLILQRVIPAYNL